MKTIGDAAVRLSILLLVAAFVLPAPADARRRRARAGLLVIDAMTDGAKVYIDGKPVGKTPLDEPIRLKPGKHTIKATKFGFSTFEMEFTIRRGKRTGLMVDLVPHSGLVKFDCNIKGAEVYLDSKLIGHTPLIKNVSIGDHEVMIVREGYNDFAAEINVKAGQKQFVEGVLTPFQDFSPEVLALKQKQEEQARRNAEQAEQAAAAPPPATTAGATEPAPSWTDDWYEKWWLWTAVGAVVVTAVAVPVAVTSGGGGSGLGDHSSPIDPIQLP